MHHLASDNRESEAEWGWGYWSSSFIIIIFIVIIMAPQHNHQLQCTNNTCDQTGASFACYCLLCPGYANYNLVTDNVSRKCIVWTLGGRTLEKYLNLRGQRIKGSVLTVPGQSLLVFLIALHLSRSQASMVLIKFKLEKTWMYISM